LRQENIVKSGQLAMKILLIAHYWYPWNNWGAFRWMNFGQYIDFDVLTTKQPIQSFVDSSLPDPGKKTFRFGKKLPAIIWGFLASVAVQFKRYDVYIFTSPPAMLLFGAWLLQLRRKKVLVDMRDSINNWCQRASFLVPFYSFLYQRIKNVTVSWRFLDQSKPVVYHGYENINSNGGFKGYYRGKVDHNSYLRLLEAGFMPDQSRKPEGYGTSSWWTFKKLGYPANVRLHPEAYETEPMTIKSQAMIMKDIIDGIYGN